MPFNFQSPWVAGANALRDYMIERAQERRQEQLDAFTKQAAADTHAERQRQAERQVQADQRQQQADTEARADRMAAIYGPNADLPAGAEAALKAGGYSVAQQRTIPARSITNAPTGIPGVVSQGAPAVPGMILPSTAYGANRRTETFIETKARQQREAAMAERDDERTFKWDTARAAEGARRGQADEANQVRLEIAQGNAQQRAEAAAARVEGARTNADLQRARLELQQAMADMKVDDAQKDRREKGQAVAIGRSEIRELAQSLIEDPALDSITGSVEGRRDTFIRGANVDALRRLQQLVNKLSLESRGKLKGQGQVSDYEGKMLASAVSAIDRSAGPETVRKHLRDIVRAFDGDAPNAGHGGQDAAGDSSSGVVRWGRDAAGRPVRVR